jgi:hypothetical protein
MKLPAQQVRSRARILLSKSSLGTACGSPCAQVAVAVRKQRGQCKAKEVMWVMGGRQSAGKSVPEVALWRQPGRTIGTGLGSEPGCLSQFCLMDSDSGWPGQRVGPGDPLALLICDLGAGSKHSLSHPFHEWLIASPALHTGAPDPAEDTDNTITEEDSSMLQVKQTCHRGHFTDEKMAQQRQLGGVSQQYRACLAFGTPWVQSP